MTAWGYVYCSVLGLCNFLILRSCFTLGLKYTLIHGLGIPAIRFAVFCGAVVTLAGGIAHRAGGFNPDVRDPWAWVVVFGVPIVFAFISRGALDPGWRNLQQGKALWQGVIPVPVGAIDPNASSYKDHPNVVAARELIRKAVLHAPDTNTDAARAAANAAIAWQELGLLHRAINDFTEARSCFEKSLATVNEAHSAHPSILSAKRETLFRLAELDQVLGRPEEAKRGYQQSLEIDELLGHDDPVGESTTQALLSKL